jgi:hypothetical protein
MQTTISHQKFKTFYKNNWSFWSVLNGNRLVNLPYLSKLLTKGFVLKMIWIELNTNFLKKERNVFAKVEYTREKSSLLHEQRRIWIRSPLSKDSSPKSCKHKIDFDPPQETHPQFYLTPTFRRKLISVFIPKGCF